MNKSRIGFKLFSVLAIVLSFTYFSGVGMGKNIGLQISLVKSSLAQEVASPSPSPASLEPISVVKEFDVVGFIDKLTAMMASSEGVAGVVLALIFAVAKRVSNEHASKAVKIIQKFCDLAPRAILAFGKLVNKFCEILAKALASDGFLGKP